MKKTTRRIGDGRKLPTRSVSPDSSLVAGSPQAFVERLEADAKRFMEALSLNDYRLYTGKPGCLALDILKRVEQFADSYRERAREYLATQRNPALES
jgi:hypothetical protein